VKKPAHTGRRCGAVLSASVVAALALTSATSTATSAAQTAPRFALVAAAGGFSCNNPQPSSTVQGNPHVSSVPRIESISLVPRAGGLLVSYKFRTPLVLAPEGVYLSWAIYVYRHRSDAGVPDRAVELQVEDRGKGWEPSGWTILASAGANASPVSGSVQTDTAGDELSTFFPAGFTNLRPPFYWFASQEEYRAYLPEANKAHPQNWNVNGSVTTDCPVGIRLSPNSLPNGAKLLSAGA
jgi:hypothetical protein